jgi:hypothetical protein
MKLSDQALSCVMVALQKSIMEQIDIVPTLKGFEIEVQGDELFVKNPPRTLNSFQEEK